MQYRETSFLKKSGDIPVRLKPELPTTISNGSAKKMNQQGSNVEIVTVWGYGFKLAIKE